MMVIVENYILFEIEGAAYAVRTSQVEMIEMVESITRVPNAPGFVEGVTAVRGQVVPVISVRRRFHMQPIPLDIRSRLVITRLENRLVGMLVDTAREFARITPDQIKAVDSLSGQGSEYLDGVAAMPDRLVLLVNLERLLSIEEQDILSATDGMQGEIDSGSQVASQRQHRLKP
jgi:purine-binding chemotaxis protein CheW